MKNKEQEVAPAPATEQELDLTVEDTELDLEDDDNDTEEEKESSTINPEEVYKKLKPDFVEVLNLLKYQINSESEEEAVETLLSAQKEFESFLKNKIVKKIKANVTAQVAQTTQKPGQKLNSNKRQRKTTPFI